MFLKVRYRGVMLKVLNLVWFECGFWMNRCWAWHFFSSSSISFGYASKLLSLSFLRSSIFYIFPFLGGYLSLKMTSKAYLASKLICFMSHIVLSSFFFSVLWWWGYFYPIKSWLLTSRIVLYLLRIKVTFDWWSLWTPTTS